MNPFLLEAEKYATSIIRSQLSHVYIYHNLSHTQRVVKFTNKLIEAENISEADAENLLISAWFHDTGYTEGTDNHEEISVKIATEFLNTQNASAEKIMAVSKIIMATQKDYEPQNLLEKIIRDADYAHFGSKEFLESSELLRQELAQSSDKVYTDREWTQININFLTKNHQFHTSYALNNWQQGKDKNLAMLFKILKKQGLEAIKIKEKNEESLFKKNKAKYPERGIETMFRVTLKNHITLSNIADTKANILLSVNAIIVSLVLSNLVSKLDNPSNNYLIIPTVIFVLFTVATIILSILATRPNITTGKFTREDVSNKKVNLLFFGNFHKMSLEDFEWAMGEMMKDRDYLYSSMKKDLYALGYVLNKKYNMLRITYSVFMIGIIVSVIAFFIAFNYQGYLN